ncbi:MAG: HAD hydrolase-like protein [Paracoccaceae bacterium]|nr:HAD hydrolase-like protein [Paracoccaceae bacterium]
MAFVFLDLDGTLTDPKPGITGSVIHALHELGFEAPSPDNLEWVIGPPLLWSFEKLGVADPHAALALYREHYQKSGLFEASVYAGIVEALSEIRDSGHRLFLATAKPHIYAKRITAHFGLSSFMEAEFGPELDGTRNDKGELLKFALEQIAQSQPAVMVGDRENDFRAARVIGAAAIGVDWGYGTDDELATADRICRAPSDLPNVIAELVG